MLDIVFLVNIEAGRLERKACLLIESIRRFGGPMADTPIWSFQPREGEALLPETYQLLMREKVFHLHHPLNPHTDFPHPRVQKWGRKISGVLNKPYVAKFAEDCLRGKARRIAFLDSDTMVVQAPRDLLIEDPYVVGIRPEDKRGKIGVPRGEALTPFWKQLYKIGKIDPEKVWSVTTVLDQQEIYPYYNSGIVVANPEYGLFNRWLEITEGILRYKEDLDVFPHERSIFFTEQASMAAAIMSMLQPGQVKELDTRYNYPLHHQTGLSAEKRRDNLKEIVIAHYHGAFDEDEWKDAIRITEPYREFLQTRTPFEMPKRSLMQRAYRRIVSGVTS